MRQDYRPEPVRTMVVMGESNAYGMCASDPQNEWVQVLAGLIRRHQDGYLRVINASIPSNVISPACPGYEPFVDQFMKSPSALERFEQDVLSFVPDLVFYAYGLNDASSAHDPASFLADYEIMLRDTRAQLPETLIVLLSPYWVWPHDLESWALPQNAERRRAWGGDETSFPLGNEIVKQNLSGIRELSERFGCLFIDVYRVAEGSEWLLHQDDIHYNDVGQTMIGVTIFAELAANCSFLAHKSIEAYTAGGFSIHDTGGTNALPGPIGTWRFSRPEQFDTGSR